MGEPKDLWKCEGCAGWFDFRAVPDHEQALPAQAGIECSCPDPNIQQRFVWPEATRLNAIDRVMRACQNIATRFRASELCDATV